MGHIVFDTSCDLLALDTQLFIYFLERHPIYFSLVQDIFTRIEKGEVQAAASSLAFTEIFVPAYRHKMLSQVTEVFRLLTNFPNLRFTDISPCIAQEAARIRADYNLRTPDALHVASALDVQADVFVTNDHGLQSVSPEIHVSQLKDWIDTAE